MVWRTVLSMSCLLACSCVAGFGREGRLPQGKPEMRPAHAFLERLGDTGSPVAERDLPAISDTSATDAAHGFAQPYTERPLVVYDPASSRLYVVNAPVPRTFTVNLVDPLGKSWSRDYVVTEQDGVVGKNREGNQFTCGLVARFDPASGMEYGLPVFYVSFDDGAFSTSGTWFVTVHSMFPRGFSFDNSFVVTARSPSIGSDTPFSPLGSESSSFHPGDRFVISARAAPGAPAIVALYVKDESTGIVRPVGGSQILADGSGHCVLGVSITEGFAPGVYYPALIAGSGDPLVGRSIRIRS